MVGLAKILHSVCYTSDISRCNDIVVLLFRCIYVFLIMMTMMMATMMMTMKAMMPLVMTIMTTMRSSDAPDI